VSTIEQGVDEEEEFDDSMKRRTCVKRKRKLSRKGCFTIEEKERKRDNEAKNFVKL
jgi:hypothetical protein